MLRFQDTVYLWALAAVPLLVLLYLAVVAWKKRTARKIGDADLVRELTRRYSPQRFFIKFVLLTVAFAAGVVAIANLRKPEGQQKITRNGIDVMLAIDVSKSMLAQDIKPNRLERAKQLMGKLLDQLSNDRIGMVVFAGKSYIQMPLTADHSAAKLYLSAINTDMVPTQGTVIGDALKMCFTSLSSKEKKYKAVVLVSDGEDHDEGAEKIAAAMAEEGISINTIGIGSAEGANIIDATTNELKKDEDGNTVVSKLNEEGLKAIAEKGKGTYQLFSTTDEVVAKLEQQLGSMGQRSVTQSSAGSYYYFFPWFIGLAVLLLIIELLLSERRRRPVLAKALATLLIAAPLGAAAQKETNTIIGKGNKAYNKGAYDTAIIQYKKVTEKDPKNAVANYNMGNALYKNQQAEDAVAAYNQSIANAKTPQDKSQAFYNKGVVLQNNKKLPECIDAYKNALKLNPGDEEARLNLQKALQQQKQQQQQQKQDKKQQKDPKQDEKQKEKQKPKEDKDKNELPKPQPSRLNKQDAADKLKALSQQEQNLQEKLRKVKADAAKKPAKDW